MKAQRQLTAAIFCVMLSGCAAGPEHESFAPLERAHGQTFEGYTEAVYDLSGTSGRFGEAKLWSRGAYTAQGVTLIHVGFDFDNGGQNPLTLSPSLVRLESVQANGDVLRDVPVNSPTDIATIPPDSTGRVELVFTLPPSVRPANVRAFRVAWSVQSDGQRFTEFTPFARTEPSTYYVPVHAYFYPYYPYYYPFYDPYWGPRSRVVIVKRHYPRRVVVRGRRLR